jgi:hypothetical protein
MKIKNLSWLLATMLALPACDSEFDIPEVNTEGDEEVAVTYSVQLPDAAQTRAYSDGTKAKDLHYAVYDVTGLSEDSINDLEAACALKPTLSENVTLVDGAADVKFNLIKGKKYQIVFWAQATTAPYIYHDNSHLVTVNYANAYSNDDDLDAFSGFEEVDVDGAYGRSLFLTRAVAQINFGTHDLDVARAMQLNVNRSTISTQAYTQLNLRTREASQAEPITFKYADIPSGETFPSNLEDATTEEYTYVSMNYILAPVQEDTLESITLKVDNVFEMTFPMVPYRQNHRTNIYGDIFTDVAKYQVAICSEYEEPWDGVTQTAKAPVNDVFYFGSPDELARLWFKANEDGKTYEGQTVILTQDINLNSQYWDPIAASDMEWPYDDGTQGPADFRGTFDGNGQTIYNLNVDLSKLQSLDRYYYDDYGEVDEISQDEYNRAGFFGKLNGATVKNLTIENVIIHVNTGYQGSEGMYVGILAGTAANTHFENIKIKGVVIVTVDGSKCKAQSGYLGGLVGDARGCTFKDIEIDVDGTSYIEGSDCPFVGGVVGRYLGNTGDPNQFENVKSNLNVIASNPTIKKKTAVGGLIGEINTYTRSLTNCSCSGLVTLNNYAGSITDASGAAQMNTYNMAIGGLVGAGYGFTDKNKAVFTDCSFTGSILSNFVSAESTTTVHTETVKANNPNWRYMGWLDGSPWKTNEGCLTITPEVQ